MKAAGGKEGVFPLDISRQAYGAGEVEYRDGLTARVCRSRIPMRWIRPGRPGMGMPSLQGKRKPGIGMPCLQVRRWSIENRVWGRPDRKGICRSRIPMRRIRPGRPGIGMPCLQVRRWSIENRVWGRPDRKGICRSRIPMRRIRPGRPGMGMLGIRMPSIGMPCLETGQCGGGGGHRDALATGKGETGHREGLTARVCRSRIPMRRIRPRRPGMGMLGIRMPLS
jgi:hypothetical protein